jgi:hypothetical protein
MPEQALTPKNASWMLDWIRGKFHILVPKHTQHLGRNQQMALTPQFCQAARLQARLC